MMKHMWVPVPQRVLGFGISSVKAASTSPISLRWYHAGGMPADQKSENLIRETNSKVTSTQELGFTSTNRVILGKVLGIDPEDVKKAPFKELREEKVIKMSSLLHEFNFPRSSLLNYPKLLMMSTGAVENYIRIMQECCFQKVSETSILRFRTVLNQRLPVLQKSMSMPKMEIVVKSCVKALNQDGDDEFFSMLMASLPVDENITMLELRTHILLAYLRKMSLWDTVNTRDFNSKHRRLYYRSMQWIRRCYEILTMQFEYTNEKMRKHLYLLQADPCKIEKISQIKTLSGMDMKKLGQCRPKILMSSYETLMNIENNVVKHGLSQESVQKNPEIFTLSASTVERRLEEMDTVPEFQLLKSHPRAARLLYYQTKAKSRLEDFRSSQSRMPSLHFLSADTKRFQKSTSSGTVKMRGTDLMIYLSESLGSNDSQRIRDSIMRHPHWLHIPLVNLNTVLVYLRKLGSFSNNQLIDALPILLYPKHKVEKEVESVLKSQEAKLSDKYFLQMVLYFLERPIHFTGDAVWPDNRVSDDDEDGES